MRPVAYLNAKCTGTVSPLGPCVVPVVGVIVTARHPVYINGKPIASMGDLVSYGGLIYPYTGGGPIYVTWLGRLLSNPTPTYVNGISIATVGTLTDSGGYVIEGDPTIYA